MGGGGGNYADTVELGPTNARAHTDTQQKHHESNMSALQWPLYAQGEMATAVPTATAAPAATAAASSTSPADKCNYACTLPVNFYF